MTDTNIIEIFCVFDDFRKYFAPELKKYMLDISGKHRHNRWCVMSNSEIMTIFVLFNTEHHRDFKAFYLGNVCNHMCKEFPKRISCNCFVECQAKVGLYLMLFFQICALGKCTWISIIDSTSLKSCHIKRAYSHETMGGCKKQDYGGMVLRIKSAYRDQRPRRDNVVEANAMKRGR